MAMYSKFAEANEPRRRGSVQVCSVKQVYTIESELMRASEHLHVDTVLRLLARHGKPP